MTVTGNDRNLWGLKMKMTLNDFDPAAPKEKNTELLQIFFLNVRNSDYLYIPLSLDNKIISG